MLRRFALDGFIPMLHALRNHVPTFAGKVVPGIRTDLPTIVTRGKELLEIFLNQVEPHMARNDFIAGPRLTVADITARLAKALETGISASYPAVAALVRQGLGPPGLSAFRTEA